LGFRDHYQNLAGLHSLVLPASVEGSKLPPTLVGYHECSGSEGHRTLLARLAGKATKGWATINALQFLESEPWFNILTIRTEHSAVANGFNATAQVVNLGGPSEFAASIDGQRAQIAKIAEALGIRPKL
jgi:hypothetical protein